LVGEGNVGQKKPTVLLVVSVVVFILVQLKSRVFMELVVKVEIH